MGCNRGATMKIAINGFGRIGRTFFRAALEKDIDIVAINDIGDIKTLGHLLKYDSTYGILDQDVEIANDEFKVGQKSIKFLSIKDPSELPWKEMEIDIVIESPASRCFCETSLVQKI